jgi:hypothetical protein
MAGILASVQTAEITSGVAKKTVLQLVAAANHRVKVKEISVSFKGTSGSATPVLVQVLRQSDAGTGGDALTAKEFDESIDETIQTTALKDIDGSEPTGTDEIMGEEIHPQGGWTWQAPFGGEIPVGGGNRLGIAVTAAESQTVKARMVFEE